MSLVALVAAIAWLALHHSFVRQMAGSDGQGTESSTIALRQAQLQVYSNREQEGFLDWRVGSEDLD